MAKRKVAKTYTADEMRALKKRLADHKGKLIDRMTTALQTAIDFDVSVQLRDDAQFLCATCMILHGGGNPGEGESIIDTCLFLAEHRGPQSVPHLNDCGLDS